MKMSEAWNKLKPIVSETVKIYSCALKRSTFRRYLCASDSGKYTCCQYRSHTVFGQACPSGRNGYSPPGRRDYFAPRGLWPSTVAGLTERLMTRGDSVHRLQGSLLGWGLRLHHPVEARAFSSSAGRGGGEDDLGNGGSGAASGVDDSGSSDDGSGATPPVEFAQQLTALSPMTVPEVWPRVPVIAVRRNPLFPRFIKMIEASNRQCILQLDTFYSY